MKKEIEHILVIPRDALPDKGNTQGFIPEHQSHLEGFFQKGLTQFVPRWDDPDAKKGGAEENPQLKQLIPYCLLVQNDKILCYSRGGSGGEARLHAKLSLGIGGHINPIDHQEALAKTAEGGNSTITLETYKLAVRRELEEEIKLAHLSRLAEPVCRGLINDDSNAVGQVHLGVIEVIELLSGQVAPGESAIVEPQFLSIQEILAQRDRFESWSQIVIDHLDQILPVINFRFDIGNSTEGQIGLCGTVKARSKSGAISALSEALPDTLEIRGWLSGDGRRFGHVNVYINAESIQPENLQPENV